MQGLLIVIDRLGSENASLQQQVISLQAERDQLLAALDEARQVEPSDVDV